jgi:hypothetical protein
MSTEQVKPAVAVSEEVRPYFDAAAQGRLLVKRCSDCGQQHHYPRAMCPFCASDQTEWTEASGAGTIYSFAVAKLPSGGAHVLAYVTLDDCELTMLTNIVADAPADLRIGDAVNVIFRDVADGIVIPMFSPAKSA